MRTLPPVLLGTALALGAAGCAQAATAGAADEVQQQVAAQQPDTQSVPTFGQISMYAPSGPPKTVVLFISGDGGWNLGVVSMAERLRSLGALVVGIDIRAFERNLEASPGCAYPAGALEDLARAVELRYRIPAYQRPILVGYSSGATLVYAALSAAPAETFAGGISLGFCPVLEIRKAPCAMRGLEAKRAAHGAGFELAPFAGLAVPWMVLQGDIDQVCAPAITRAFVAATGNNARLFPLPKVGHGFGVPRNWDPAFVEAYRAVAGNAAPRQESERTVPDVADLPLVEVPVAGDRSSGEMAILLTGDGGWAELDKAVAAGLAASGVPTVGWSSLSYYWTPRTPDAAAADLARIITSFGDAWGASRVRLVGYSFGANVLPFLVTRLPADIRQRIRSVTLLGPTATAEFEFHVADWFGAEIEKPRYPTVPEIRRLDVPVTCVAGTDETDSPCRTLAGSRVTVDSVGAGHHFSGDYQRLVQLVLTGP